MKSNELGSLEAIGIILTVIIVHIIIYLPARIIGQIGSASILNVCYITVVIFILTFIILKLFKNFNNFDILDIASFLGGPILKKALAFLFTGYCIFLAGLFIRDFAESLKIIYFHDFNISLIILMFLLGSIIINRFGFRKVVRCSFIILPAIVISIIIVFIASIPEFTYQRVLPVLGYGAKKTFLVGLTNISAFSDFIILYYLIPLLKDKKGFTKVSFISMGLSSFFLILRSVYASSYFKLRNIAKCIVYIYCHKKNIIWCIFAKTRFLIYINLDIVNVFLFISYYMFI